MRNVLSTRLARLVLDEWREVAFREKVLQFAVSILEIKLLHRAFRLWRLECLHELFAARRKEREQADAIILARPVLKSWFIVTVELNKRKRIVEAVVLVRRISRMTYIWIEECREARFLRSKANRVIAITQSRILAKSFTCMRDLYRNRPASLRFRLNLDSFKKYVPSIRRDQGFADTWTSTSLLSTRGDLSPSAIHPHSRPTPPLSQFKDCSPVATPDLNISVGHQGPAPLLSLFKDCSPVATPDLNISFSKTLPASLHRFEVGPRPPSLAGLRRKGLSLI